RIKRQPDGRVRLVGQDGQVLGHATAGARRDVAMPGPRLLARRQERPPRHRHGGPLHQHC
ncbi:hypothetical protein BN1723_020574, partial [Verticillium longisporum]